MANLVDCRGLRLGYGSNILQPCPDFTVGAGDYLCIVGPNGAGKTTLLKCLAGLLKPLDGTMTLAPGLASGGIGYLPQQGPLQRDFRRPCAKSCSRACPALGNLRPRNRGSGGTC